MYRLRLISRDFGVDDSGPLHASLEQARRAGEMLHHLYQGRVRVEIYKVLDFRTRKTEKIETLTLLEQAGSAWLPA